LRVEGEATIGSPRRLGPVLLLGLLGLIGGCTYSSLYVESDPPGAMVYFDGKPQGTTPVEIPFDWYGGHRLRLRMEGYQEMVQIETLRAPLHYRVPFDLITTLIPATIPDRQRLSYTLVSSATEAQEAGEP